MRIARSNTQHRTFYWVELVLSSGEHVPLKSVPKGLAETIRNFLNLPDPVEVPMPIPGFRQLFGMVFNPGAQQEKMIAQYQPVIAKHEEEIRRDPENIDAYQKLAVALAMQNQPEEAMAKLEHAKDLLLKRGNHDGAKQLDTMIRQMDKAVRRA